MESSKQVDQKPNDFTLTKKENHTDKRRENNSVLEKARNSMVMEKHSPSSRRMTGQKDTKRTQYERAVLQAYGIVPAQGYFASFKTKAGDSTTEFITAPSNIKAIIDGFLG